jgi:FtsP/CotA-like multicopper oxidase with cupredoxin domain
MRTRTFTFRLGAIALASSSLGLAASQASAAEYWLKAGTTTVTLPGPTGPVDVPMWGYASCSTPTLELGAFASCGLVSVPGPALTVPFGDDTLKVHLLNALAVPTSLVINGLLKPMVAVWDDNSTGLRPSPTARVRSFDAEAAPNGTAEYTWGSAAKPVKPGSYLYQSGTQPQVQVQMGLYGAASKNATDAGAAPAEAYAGVAFDNQATLLYSEIDPALHQAIGGTKPTYGTASGPTSTINYEPKYFLINGQPFPQGTPVIAPAGNPGTTLLRLLNAGLTTHVPMIQGTHWTVVAEDGKPYKYPRTQYTALLPAAKTTDVLLTPDSGGAVYPIMDRRLSLSNNGLSDGGMLAFLQYAALGVSGTAGTSSGNSPPVANADLYNSILGVTLNVGAPEGVLANDDNTDGLPLPIKAVAASGETACKGTYTLHTNGSFIYTPPATLPPGCASGSDSFIYQVTDGKALAVSPATVTINLAAPAEPTLAILDSFTRTPAGLALPDLGTNWSQQKSTTTSGKDAGVTAGGVATANTTALGGLAIWTAPNFGPIQAAGATLSANAYLVLKATGPNADAPVNYVRVGCVAGQIAVSTSMGGSNISLYAKQAAFGSCVDGSNALRAAIDAKGLVTVFDSSGYVGGVQLPDVAAWKGGGRIGIQLTAVGATADDFAGPTPLP